MPPKGWRKNAEGKFPQNNRDLENISIDDILFPKSVIQKLAKNIVLSEDGNMIISKDSLTALQRSATVFVSHLMFHARLVAKNAERKTVNSLDILQALEKAELTGFVPEVKQKLAAFEHNAEIKKKQKAEAKAEAGKDDADEEPATKKLKDNLEQGVRPNNDADGDEDAENEVEDDDETEVNTVNEDDEEVDDEDGDDDTTREEKPQNPITLLNREENELEGSHSEREQNDTADGADEDDE
uniref:DNA polymerase epsilon subunit D n=1 Tax=Candidozyma auris TaxID=498019 RepID=A0A0L0P795_CANAR